MDHGRPSRKRPPPSDLPSGVAPLGSSGPTDESLSRRPIKRIRTSSDTYNLPLFPTSALIPSRFQSPEPSTGPRDISGLSETLGALGITRSLGGGGQYAPPSGDPAPRQPQVLSYSQIQSVSIEPYTEPLPQLSREVPAKEFHMFRTLPPEMRIMIWRFTFQRRIIRPEPGGGKRPVAMLTSRESYDTYKRHYTLIKFHVNPDKLRRYLFQWLSLVPWGLWVNFEIDILNVSAVWLRYNQMIPYDSLLQTMSLGMVD